MIFPKHIKGNLWQSESPATTKLSPISSSVCPRITDALNLLFYLLKWLYWNITCLNHLGTFQLHLEEKPSNSNPFSVVLSPPWIQTLGHTTTCGVPGPLTLGAPTPHPRVVVAKDERLRPRAYCHCGLWSCLDSNKKIMWCYSIGNHSVLMSLFCPSAAGYQPWWHRNPDRSSPRREMGQSAPDNHGAVNGNGYETS